MPAEWQPRSLRSASAGANATSPALADDTGRPPTLTPPETRAYGPASPARTARKFVLIRENVVPRRACPVSLLAALALTIVGSVGGAAPHAGAQTVIGAASLRQLTRDADTVVRARITAGTAEIEADGRTFPIVHVEVLAALKGPTAPGALVFANVGKGVARYVEGEEVLLFLRNIERVAELAATSVQARLRYVIIPNAGEKIVLTDTLRPTVSEAVRRYVALESIPDPETRGDTLRALSLELMKSGEPLLVTSVLRDLAPGGDAAALTLADLPAMVPLIESPRVPIGTRIAVVAELERRGLVFGPARWVRLLRTSRGDDLLAVIRAVGEHPSAGVNAHLIPLLGDRDLAIATAAASSLGVPGNVDAVRPLTASLSRNDDALRYAVLRSLARVGTQSARQALELVAARHPDRALRERAETDAIILARRHGTTLAPTFGLTVSDNLVTAPADAR